MVSNISIFPYFFKAVFCSTAFKRICLSFFSPFLFVVHLTTSKDLNSTANEVAAASQTPNRKQPNKTIVQKCTYIENQSILNVVK
jgi:hypothetical protein